MSEERPAAAPITTASDTGQEDPFGGLRPGTQVGKYEIVEMLGQGGFGITYRARDGQLRRDVAIKEYLPASFAVRQGGTTVLPRSTQTAEDFRWGRERFLDEARTLATLEDAPGIVNVYDFMEANGTAYMVMGLVRGETVEARLKRDGRLPQPAIEQLVYPLLDGLERVHAAGFLHRDIKPANILLDGHGRPTLIDFGASRVALQGRTQALTAVYTPGYAAFEQSTSARQGPWTDIYALAATLYHCITGAPPPSAIDRMIDDRLVPAADAGKGRYAPSLLAAIDAGLTLKPTERPQTIAQWRQVLSGTAHSAGHASPDATRRMEATRRTGSATPQAAAPAQSRKRMPVAWIAAGIVALAIAGGGAWLALRPGEERTAMDGVPPPQTDDAQRRAADEQRAARDEQARKAAEDARAAEEEAARKAAQEKAAAEAAQRQAEEQARADAARQQAEAEEAKRRAEAEARAAEAQVRADADAKRQAEAAEIALRLSDQDRKRVQVALSSLGYGTQGTDGTFGPRTRQMIAAWQKGQGA
ncbi:serine/threonine-protein kinase, partial [Vineibacter terrae]|uniref:serine/threonine-protein kinase n=1 Tax=Vineibacter terrae TaxID=2586908 RepID=UPI002E380CD5